MSGTAVLMSVSLGNLHSVFQSRGILCVILTVNQNQGVVLMVFDDVHHASKVLFTIFLLSQSILFGCFNKPYRNIIYSLIKECD